MTDFGQHEDEPEQQQERMYSHACIDMYIIEVPPTTIHVPRRHCTHSANDFLDEPDLT